MFTPGAGASGQVHDFNPGILPNGLFWTMSIPRHSFRVFRNGQHAWLRVRNLPMPDTFQFGNNVSVAGQIDVNVWWRATSDPVLRGNGASVPNDDPSAFLGHFADARCVGYASGAETGFAFRTRRLTADDFFAELGRERNGVFL